MRVKNSLLNKWFGVTGYPDIKEWSRLLTHTYTKVNSKWIIDLNVTARTIQLLEENTGVNPHDLEARSS